MLTNLYAIFDTASGIYDGPFKMQTDQTALRTFGDLVMNEESAVGKHPEDFALVRVGAWNDNTAELVSLEKETLQTGLEAVAARRNVTEIGEANA